MRNLHALKRSLGAAVALAVAVIGWMPSAAEALPFQYTTGDLVAVINKAGTDLILNFGQIPTSGTTTKSFALPTQFGGTLANATFNGGFSIPDDQTFPEIIAITTTSPLNFPDPTGQFATGIAGSFQSLNPPGGWFGGLGGFAAPPGGGQVYIRDFNILAVDASVSGSYTNSIGLGTDAINSQLTNGVNTRKLFGVATSASLPFYRLTYTFNDNGDSVYQKALLGTLTAALNGSSVDLTFTAIPEPGTMLLLTSGLVGLSVAGRKRCAQ
jgi:hypothetical protein